MPRWVVLGAVLVVTLLLGVVDVVTGFEISFSFFYLLPVSVAAWVAGRRAGTLMSAIATGIWLVANQLGGQVYSQPGVAVWNAGTRFGFFIVVALLLAEFRRIFALERRLARSDPLTGLLNRGAFYETVSAELERARRFSHPVALAYLDLDDFKSINDARGHEAGDRVLERVASMIRSSVRSVDSVGRLGGDEFAVLLPETDEREAQLVGARLLAAFHGDASGDIVVSASIGVVSCPVAPDSVEALVTAADTLMYQVKRAAGDAVLYLEYPG